MYSARILDHFHHPRNVGEISNPTASVEVTNPVCGDVLRISAVVSSGAVVEAKFKVSGCVPAVACGSWVTASILKQPVRALQPITASEIEAALDGLPSASKHASMLAAEALKRLLEELVRCNVESGNSKVETRS